MIVCPLIWLVSVVLQAASSGDDTHRPAASRPPEELADRTGTRAVIAATCLVYGVAMDETLRTPARVAVCSAEAYTDAPAGPALRAAGLARGLAAHGLATVLVAPAGSHAPEGTALASLDDLEAIVRSDSTMIISGFLLERYPVLADARHIVVDAAGPFLLENLVVHQHESAERRRRVLTDESAVLARLLASADLVLCAHDRQRDLTLGMMLASGALLPELIDADPGLERMFLNVPFGPTGEVAALEHASEPGRLHLVWPGGLWDWLDPLTLVEAISRAREAGANVTAELWGARSPDPLVPASRGAASVTQRAKELGLEDAIEVVSWVPHSERLARLARADAAVTLDPGGIEARYAFRTRLVDALAAGLPVIATAGEHVVDTATASGAGFVVGPGDSDGLASLLRALCADPARIERAREETVAVATRWAYEQTIAPLGAWCREPRRARAETPTISRPERGAAAQSRKLAERVQRALKSSTRAS
jgi:glycosyltransferase involved in cell wall biosynthesis